MTQRKRRILSVLTWILVLFEVLGLGLAGFAKLGGGAETWQNMFVSWGYAPWFATIIGVLELIGAIALILPKATVYAAAMLIVIMLGALYTVLANDSNLGPVAPMIHLAVLSALIALRRPQRSDGT